MSETRSLGRRLRDQVHIELWATTVGAFVNGVLGSALMPRPLRLLGYRALGARVRSGNIFPGLRIYGALRNVEIGRRTFLNAECYLEALGPITIGEACQFGPQVMIVTSHHRTLPDGRVSRVAEARPVVIGDRVWVGARAQILPGVRIADDAVIAAGAVVARDCPVPGVYAGVPARLVRRTAVVPEPA
ncbi:DapH/DapD/GlmU-related protein [Amycolatopsis granulosa]|uniref:DapH/DapD/GlmU-related protein n=1 Tax=Amycolatopsis granulosa TaxID=185684 RepID=UPI001423E02F|nr:acetyltransferase-like isoleucine patch superfamily enzyme [Amycolatopsis granulosa]